MSVDEHADENNSDRRAHRTSRRELLRGMAGASIGLPLTPWNALLAHATAADRHKGPTPLPPPATFSPEAAMALWSLTVLPWRLGRNFPHWHRV